MNSFLGLVLSLQMAMSQPQIWVSVGDTCDLGLTCPTGQPLLKPEPMDVPAIQVWDGPEPLAVSKKTNDKGWAVIKLPTDKPWPPHCVANDKTSADAMLRIDSISNEALILRGAKPHDEVVVYCDYGGTLSWTCAEKSRILLTDEAGRKHCIKFR